MVGRCACRRSASLHFFGGETFVPFVTKLGRNAPREHSVIASQRTRAKSRGPMTGSGRWKGRRPRRNTFVESGALSLTPPPPCFAWSPSPLSRARKNRLSFPRCMCTRVLQGTAGKVRLQISEGRRSADRRIIQPSATHARVLPREHASAAVARHTLRCYHLKVLRARSPLGAPRAVLAAQINATAQPRPRFVRTGGYGCYPQPPNAPTAMHLAHRS